MPVDSARPLVDQGVIDYTGTETRQIFSRMLTKTFEELFTSTLNGIAVSVNVFVVLHAELNDQTRRIKINKTIKNE